MIAGTAEVLDLEEMLSQPRFFVQRQLEPNDEKSLYGTEEGKAFELPKIHQHRWILGSAERFRTLRCPAQIQSFCDLHGRASLVTRMPHCPTWRTLFGGSHE